MAGLKVHLAHHRKAANMTQADLATACGVSRKTINTIENKVFIPSTALALMVARVLKCSVHDLFELDDHE